MSDNYADDILKVAERILDLSIQDVTRLGHGATSTAWIISSADDRFVLRTTQPSANRPITYRSEFRILRMLLTQECPVPEPLCTSFDHPADLPGDVSAWAITRVVDGVPLHKAQMSPSIEAQLGGFLSQLHGLPCSQFGRLDEESADFIGQQHTPLEGIRARWCWAQLWP